MAWCMTNTIHSLALTHAVHELTQYHTSEMRLRNILKQQQQIIFIVHANCQNIFICLRIAISYAQTNAHTITLIHNFTRQKKKKKQCVSPCWNVLVTTVVLLVQFVCFDFIIPVRIVQFFVSNLKWFFHEIVCQNWSTILFDVTDPKERKIHTRFEL